MTKLGAVRRSQAQRDAAAAVKRWTRERFGLRAEDALSVSEIACALPGCPPVETVILFWPADGRRRFIKIFKPVTAIVENDLPPRWMKDALFREEGEDCC